MFNKLVKPVYYYYSGGKVYLGGTFLKVASCNLNSVIM